MRVFIAGATGTLGRPVVRLLLSHGHDVIGLTRSADRARTLAAQGIHAVQGDALDGRRMQALVAGARPDRVVHLLTALPPAGPRRASQLAPTNDLRVRGTANLIDAAVTAGVRRLVAESFVAVYGQVPADRKVAEDEPLSEVRAGAFADTVRALRSLERQLRDARDEHRLETVALRVGYLYGSDVPATRELGRLAAAGRLFVPRDLAGVGPFVHVEDAAAAIVAAVEHPHPSAVYNVVDDEAISLRGFASELASAIGARPPRHLPRWLLRMAAPLMAELGSATLVLSNDRLKRELQWTPRYPTVRVGLGEIATHAAEAA